MYQSVNHHINAYCFYIILICSGFYKDYIFIPKHHIFLILHTGVTTILPLILPNHHHNIFILTLSSIFTLFFIKITQFTPFYSLFFLSYHFFPTSRCIFSYFNLFPVTTNTRHFFHIHIYFPPLFRFM